MKHPKTFRIFWSKRDAHTDCVATEIRADEHWITLVDDSGNKLYLIKSALVNKVSLINDSPGSDTVTE